MCEKRELLIVEMQRQMASESNGLLMAEAAPSDGGGGAELYGLIGPIAEWRKRLQAA